VVVADGDERLSHFAAEEIAGEEEVEQGEREDRVEEPPIVAELEPQELRRGNACACDAAGHRFPVYDGEFDDEVGCERGDGQVEALEPERGHAEDHSDQRRDGPRGGAEVAATHARNLLQSRSMRTLPKSPYGLTMRMTTRAAKGATSFTPPPNTGSR